MVVLFQLYSIFLKPFYNLYSWHLLFLWRAWLPAVFLLPVAVVFFFLSARLRLPVWNEQTEPRVSQRERDARGRIKPCVLFLIFSGATIVMFCFFVPPAPHPALSLECSWPWSDAYMCPLGPLRSALWDSLKTMQHAKIYLPSFFNWFSMYWTLQLNYGNDDNGWNYSMMLFM